MPVKLNTFADRVDPNDPQLSSMLSNLQANILKPHGRDFARHLFLSFRASPGQMRAWIKQQITPQVTTALQQFATSGQAGADGGVVCGFFLSARGYEFLGLDTSGFASDSFRKGMQDQENGVFSKLLDLDNEDPPVLSWEPAFQQEIHALITFADDQLSVVESNVALFEASALDFVRVVGQEHGNTLRRKTEPVEHFGYFDGISQPLFTKPDLDKAQAQNPNFEAWNPGARLSLVLVDDPLTPAVDAFGSYLVYRKLAQDVASFQRRVKRLAQELGTDEDLAGAYAVGRFKDGTPVTLSKQLTAPGEFSKKNDFDFSADEAGTRCPFHAHTRKTNPRGTTPLTSLEGEKRRRIARRGIPYGPPMTGVADNLPNDDNPATPRGLLFLCFQANIEDQFEFIQRTWVDNKHFPTSVLTNGLLQRDTGDDPLIGQDADEAQRWPKKWGERAKKTINVEAAVTLRGGEYFFAPSIPFLASLAP
ncbi:MAG TPA: Dyp-type peroxidase [Polyangiaceae bacterium]|nr:Dyp-type peroxidase [Polyangiaceae bacterium]